MPRAGRGSSLDELVEQLPFPIAIAWSGLSNKATAPTSEQPRAVASVIARTLCALLLPDYLRGAPSNTVDRQLIELRERPALKRWSELLDGLSGHIVGRPSPSPFLSAGLSWLTDLDGTPSPAAGSLRALLTEHRVLPGIPPRNDRAQLEALIGGLGWLAGYRLITVVRAAPTRQRAFTGVLRVWAGLTTRELSAEWDAFLAPDGVFALSPSGDGFLELSPLIALRAAVAGGRERCALWCGASADGHKLRLDDVENGAVSDAEMSDDGREVTWRRWLETRPREAVYQSNHDRRGKLRMVPKAVELAVGDIIEDRYEIRGELGSGGMSTVYRVWDRVAEREIALKVLRATLAEDDTLGQRFRREAEIMTSVTHPHVVRARHIGELTDGRLFFTMNLYAGSVADHTRTSLPIEEVRRWSEQALSALAYLHDRGVIHRDVKPSNLLLDDDRNLRLADFGIARDTAATARLTGTLHRVGSVAWMAPEQGRDRDVTPRADIYSLARVLHELVAGSGGERRPGQGLDGAFGELIRAMGSLDPGDRPDAPEALRELCRIPATDVDSATSRTGAETSVVNVEQAVVGLANLCATELGDSSEVVDVLSQLIAEGARLIGSLREQARRASEGAALAPLALSLAHLARDVEARLELVSLTDEQKAALAGLRQQLHDRLLRPAEELADASGDASSALTADGFSGVADVEHIVGTEDEREWLQELTSTDELRAHDAVFALSVQCREQFLADLYSLDPPQRRRLLDALWERADYVVLEGRGGARDVLEAAIDLAEEPSLRTRFKHLLRMFVGAGDGRFWSDDQIRAMLEGHAPADRRVLARALLIHRRPSYRLLAIELLGPSDLWPVIVHRSTPVEWLVGLWRHLRPKIDASFLKIFFVSVRDNLLRPGDARRIMHVVELMKEFYRIDALHEDTYFDMLLAMDEPIRDEARRHGLLVDFDADYVRLFQGFVRTGRAQEQSLEGWAAVPLPVQRRLARRGHFLAHFICHPSDRIALECLRYLVVRESIVEYLKVPRINARLLIELAREKRLLRRDDARLALVTNPKTPANVLLQHIHLLPAHMLRDVVQSRECNQVARSYARQMLHRHR